ncbi:MAG: hypothetical protein MZV64_02215 [Ignavibacteriales bacterium]|nr:hypothetical protein [Ignavibacteriales bacterium]
MKIFIDPNHRLSGFETVNFYQPLFAYEIALELCQHDFPALALAPFCAGCSKQAIFSLPILVSIPSSAFCSNSCASTFRCWSGFNINQVFFALVFFCAGIGMYLRHRAVQKL